MAPAVDVNGQAQPLVATDSFSDQWDILMHSRDYEKRHAKSDTNSNHTPGLVTGTTSEDSDITGTDESYATSIHTSASTPFTLSEAQNLDDKWTFPSTDKESLVRPLGNAPVLSPKPAPPKRTRNVDKDKAAGVRETGACTRCHVGKIKVRYVT
jgi:hypothetical protein